LYFQLSVNSLICELCQNAHVKLEQLLFNSSIASDKVRLKGKTN